MHCTRAPNFRPNHNISAFFIHFIFQRIVLLTWSKTSQEKSELILALVLWVFFFFHEFYLFELYYYYSIHSVHWHSMRVLPTGFVATNVCGCRFCHTETFALPTMSNETKLRLLFDVFSQLFFFLLRLLLLLPLLSLSLSFGEALLPQWQHHTQRKNKCRQAGSGS